MVKDTEDLGHIVKKKTLRKCEEMGLEFYKDRLGLDWKRERETTFFKKIEM